MKQLLLDELELRWKRYRSKLKRCKAAYSIDAVHDLRVATRRMLAMIQLLNAVSKHERLKKLKRAFKDRLDAFDDLRDTQVMLASVSKLIKKLPQLEEFRLHLQTNETKLLRSLHDQLQQVDASGITELLSKACDAIDKESPTDVEQRVFAALDAAYATVKQRQGWVDVAHPATIHRVRLAFKTFRYLAEIIQPFVKGLSKEHMKHMNAYQSLMGEIQDASVLTKTIADYSERTELPDITPVRQYCERRHAKAIASYVLASRELDTFWRLSPNELFPWEELK